MSQTQIKPIVSTIYGADLMTSQLGKRPYRVLPKTTLNEKFGIQSGVLPAVDVYPSMNYLAIGNRGHQSHVGKNGVEVTEVLQHRPTDGALFNHLPFVVREVGNDLTPQERERFALRVVKNFHGKDFVCYFLRRLATTPNTSATQLKYYTVVKKGSDVETTVTDFVPDDAVLTPVPQPLQPVNVNTLSGEYIRCESMISFQMSKWDLDELLNAANIIYGSDRYAVISEVALVSGVDKVVEASGAGGNFNYREVIAAQCCAFISTDFRAYYHNKAVTLDINFGASEPMLKLLAP